MVVMENDRAMEKKIIFSHPVTTLLVPISTYAVVQGLTQSLHNYAIVGLNPAVSLSPLCISLLIFSFS